MTFSLRTPEGNNLLEVDFVTKKGNLTFVVSPNKKAISEFRKTQKKVAAKSQFTKVMTRVKKDLKDIQTYLKKGETDNEANLIKLKQNVIKSLKTPVKFDLWINED